MANASYVTQLLGRLPQDERASWQRVWDHVLGKSGGIALGVVEHQARAENLAGHYFTATTPSTADTEFAIAHGLGITPRMVMPVMPLNVVNAQVVDLKITRAADTQRAYFSSPSTAAVVYLYIE